MVAVVLNSATFFSSATKEDEKERYKGGEEKLLIAYNKWIFRKRKDESGSISHEDAAHGNEAIRDFDCLFQTRWTLKHELLYETPTKWQEIIDIRNIILNMSILEPRGSLQLAIVERRVRHLSGFDFESQECYILLNAGSTVDELLGTQLFV